MQTETQTNRHHILHLCHSESDGVCKVHHKRHIVGYVLHGTFTIYNNSSTTCFGKGDIFLLKAGCHYIEYHSTEGLPYEEVVVALHSEQLGSIIHKMGVTFGLNTSATCQTTPQAISGEPASYLLRLFFKSVSSYLSLRMFDKHGAMERMKMDELFYLILSNPTSNIRKQLLLMSANSRLDFEDIVRSAIFDRLSIPHLADRCNMSPSGFKKMFSKYFNDTPHHWFLTQRLENARLRLTHTTDQVKNIARECGFSTTSHFIRHFHNTYGTTPNHFRLKHITHQPEPLSPQPQCHTHTSIFPSMRE